MSEQLLSQDAQQDPSYSGGVSPNTAAMLRAAQAQAPTAGMNHPGASAMMQQQQQQVQPQQASTDQQQQPRQQSQINITNEIKRLQQLHQMGANQAPSGNALLMTGSQRPSDNPSTLLQSMLDQQQKIQNPRFEDPLLQAMGQQQNAVLQPGFLQDARLFMGQNPLPGGLVAQQPVGGAVEQRQELPLPSPHSLFHRDGTRRMRGGVIEPFPEKLHRLLLEVEAAGLSDVISFVASGRAFAIHKPDKFFKDIVPLYFRQSRLSSFKRQLNLYGFELINTGPARGGYYHELFVKDRPELCRRMRRVAVKVSSKKDETKKEREHDVQKQHKSDDKGLDIPGVQDTDDSPNKPLSAADILS